jgi:SAM-dependent methyltransferase
MGAAQAGDEDVAGAEASFRRALAISPGDHRTVFRLGRLLAGEGRLDGEFLERWLALERPVSPLLRTSALDWLCATPEFGDMPDSPDAAAPTAEALIRLAGSKVLLSVLRRVIVDDPTAERVLTSARRGLLALACRDIADASETKGALCDLACGLAVQGHLNEHVWSVSAAELGWLSLLEGRLDGSTPADIAVDPFAVAVLACYRPLSALDGSEALAVIGSARTGPLRDVIRVQVTEPAEEARIAPGIPQLNVYRSDTSSKVRHQYEEHPYPRWTERPELPGGSLESVLVALFPHLADRDSDWPDSPEMLIAGCGTGLHSIITAQRFPTARILAMDLSRRSLAYAVRCTREAGIGNLEYGQGDLLRVGDLGRSFDVIESAGVLHHLLDPLEGWRQLVGVLRPGGFMKIGLYSEIGRRAVVAGRSFVREGGWPGTTEGIREAREAIMALPQDHAAAGVLERPDFYSASACRDLLFHVQEHRYDLRQVDVMIRELGLEFVGFELAGRAHAREYRSRYPDDPHMLDLANWSELESSRPGMFSGMYLFWVRRPGTV